MKKCFVTGATGHVGNVLVSMLLEKGYDVTCMAMPNEDTSHIEKPGVKIVRADVTDIDSLRKVMRGADVVFHLAGLIDISKKNTDKVYTVNVGGTINVAQVCMENNIKTLIYTSSVHAINEQPEGMRISEDSGVDPDAVTGTYAKSKALATRYLLSLGDKLDVRIVHPAGIIGPYGFLPNNMGLLIYLYVTGKMRLYVDGGYNFVDVRDVANGIILCYEQGKAGERYILSGNYTSIKELYRTVENETGKRRPALRVTYRLAEAFAPAVEWVTELFKKKPIFTKYSITTLHQNSDFDNSKAKKELGYTPRPLHETIADTVKWISENKLVRRLRDKKKV